MEFQATLDRLAECGPLKTWSVIVTILGDLLDEGERIDGRLLRALTGPMGISDEALRVALHRLRRDGWIDTERRGREAAHGMSARGRAETEAVRSTIYARHAPPTGPLTLAVLPPEASVPGIASVLVLSPRSVIVAGPLPAGVDEALTAPVETGRLPGWIADMAAPPPLRAAYGALAEAATSALAAPPPEALTDRAVLRLSVFHQWRRLRLRHGPLPDALLPPDWEGARARDAVMRTLDRFPRPEMAKLSEAAAS